MPNSNKQIAARLVLGTAQLGMAYGVMNRDGQPAVKHALRMLASAYDGGIRILDTAQAYGNSEDVISRHLQACPNKAFKVVTKLDASIDLVDTASVVAAVERSCERVGRPLHGLLLHHPKYLSNWTEGAGPAMNAVKKAGLATNIGISVYEPVEFASAVDIDDIQFIEAPFSALDRRLLNCGLLDRAAACGKTVFLRSIFMQGLLTASGGTIPDRFVLFRRMLRDWYALCENNGLTPVQAALSYAFERSESAYIIVGCETEEQLDINLRAARVANASAVLIDSIEALPEAPKKLIDPRNWQFV